LSNYSSHCRLCFPTKRTDNAQLSNKSSTASITTRRVAKSELRPLLISRTSSLMCKRLQHGPMFCSLGMACASWATSSRFFKATWLSEQRLSITFRRLRFPCLNLLPKSEGLRRTKQ
ncbi:hypothetical protein KCU64_g78, partial [Aureobasidium melanogenum]